MIAYAGRAQLQILQLVQAIQDVDVFVAEGLAGKNKLYQVFVQSGRRILIQVQCSGMTVSYGLAKL